MANTRTSYIPRRHRLIRPQLQYLESILDRYKVSKANRRYFIHTYCSNKLQGYESPIPAQAILKYYPGADPKELQRLGLVELSDYWTNHCRRHRVSEEIMYESLALVNRMSSEEFRQHDFVFYETGRVSNRPPGPRTTTDTGKSEPDIIRCAIDRLAENKTLVSLEALDSYVQSFTLTYSPDDLKHNGLYLNDSACIEGIRMHRPLVYDANLSQYVGSWYALNTGRLYITGGCSQSGSAGLKRAAYSGIQSFKNYDAKSCQPFILIKEMERAGIDPAALVRYISTPNYKEVHGERAGLPPKSLKKIVIALCMGAHMPKSVKGYEDRDNTILDSLAEVAKNEEEMKALLERLQATVGDMAKAIRKWHLFLLDRYIPARKVKGNGGANTLTSQVTNAIRSDKVE
jgi:hypothetical protein